MATETISQSRTQTNHQGETISPTDIADVVAAFDGGPIGLVRVGDVFDYASTVQTGHVGDQE